MTAATRTVRLAGQDYHLAEPLQRQSETQFPEKVLVGRDPTASDHTLQSILVLSDFQLGWGRYRFRSTEGYDRFWVSSLDTRFTGTLTLLPAVQNQSMPGTVSVTGGLDRPHTGVFHTGYGSSGSIKPILGLGSQLVIATGDATSSSFANWTGATVRTASMPIVDIIRNERYTALAAYNGTQVAQGFLTNVETDSLTFSPASTAITNFGYQNGTVYGVSQTVGSRQMRVNWADLSGSSFQDTGVIVYRDDDVIPLQFLCGAPARGGRPSLYFGTTRALYEVYGVQPGTVTTPSTEIAPWAVYRILEWPTPADRTASPARPACGCCSEALEMTFFSVGREVWSYQNQRFVNISPFRDDGLPNGEFGGETSYNYGGNIVCLTPRNTGVIAVVGGDGAQAAPLVLYWNGTGWHTLLRGVAGELFGQCFTWNGALYVRTNGASGRQLRGFWDPDVVQPPWIRASSDRPAFAAGELVTPYYDANLPTTRKLAFAVQVNYGPGRVQVAYQRDDETSWTDLGWQETARHNQIATFTLGDGYGVPFTSLRLRLTLSPYGSTTSYAICDYVALKYVLRPEILFSWSVAIDTAEDHGPQRDVYAELLAITQSTELVDLEVDGERHRVLVGLYDGEEPLDRRRDARGVIRLTLLEPV